MTLETLGVAMQLVGYAGLVFLAVIGGWRIGVKWWSR